MKNLLTTVLSLIVFLSVKAQVSTLTRNNDPVVLTGANLPSYLTLNTSAIVGFKYVSNNWIQIPIQVDERAMKDIVTPYGSLAAASGYPPSPSNPQIYFYCDAATYTGADPTPGFDSDDELVFMAKDAGGLFNGSAWPAGIVTGTCSQVKITDPLGGTGYVYLFQNNGSLNQDAGVSYVNYNFSGSGATYPAHLSGVYNENSSITTSKYSWHFSAEWVSDELKIALGTNTDILDRHKNFYANGNCTRSEDTFSAGENAYVTNKSGPIRVIRSYMGANSGPLTQRTHLFYQGRQDISTDLRVHNIVSIVDAFDYNSNASGMIYRNSLNTAGVTINGVQDVLAAGNIGWEMVSGTQGSLVILHRSTTTLTAADASVASYYDDNSSAPGSSCTGDGQAWGTSGTMINFLNGSVCTDPMGGSCAGSQWYRTMQARRILYMETPNANTSVATNYDNQFNNPLQVTVSSCPALTVTSITPVDAINTITVNAIGGRLHFRNLVDGVNYSVSVFNNLGQLVASGAVQRFQSTMNVAAKGLVTVVIKTNKKAIGSFRVMM